MISVCPSPPRYETLKNRTHREELRAPAIVESLTITLARSPLWVVWNVESALIHGLLQRYV